MLTMTVNDIRKIRYQMSNRNFDASIVAKIARDKRTFLAASATAGDSDVFIAKYKA